MSVKIFLEMYDNWNGKTRINDDNLNLIVEGHTSLIYENPNNMMNYHGRNILEMEVVSFGFYENVLTIRVK